MSSNVGEVGHIVGRKYDVRRVVRGERLSHNHLCGVEIELAGYGGSGPFHYWSVITDGSLRGRNTAEFILDAPLGGADLEDALEEFANFKNSCLTLNTNHTCSVHVHVDVRNMSNRQLLTMLVVYLAFEKGLFKLSGGRESNPFCAPLYSIEAFVDDLGNTDTHDWIMNCSHFGRYAGLNLAAVHKYGSVEFRHHEGTLDTDRILKWIDVVGRLKTFAMEVDPEEDLMLLASASGYSEFANRIFGTTAREMYYPGAEGDLMAGIRLAQDVVYKYRGMRDEQYAEEILASQRLDDKKGTLSIKSSGYALLRKFYPSRPPTTGTGIPDYFNGYLDFPTTAVEEVTAAPAPEDF